MIDEEFIKTFTESMNAVNKVSHIHLKHTIIMYLEKIKDRLLDNYTNKDDVVYYIDTKIKELEGEKE